MFPPRAQEGKSPLHCAAAAGHCEAIRILVKDYHVSVTAYSLVSSTPLSRTCCVVLYVHVHMNEIIIIVQHAHYNCMLLICSTTHYTVLYTVYVQESNIVQHNVYVRTCTLFVHTGTI